MRLESPAVEGAESAQDRAVESPSTRAQAGSVLIAENDEVIRRSVKRVLERHRLTAVPTSDGKEALDRLEGHAGEVDLVITDLVMPRMGGVEPFRMARLHGIVPTAPSRSQWRREAGPDPELPLPGIHVHRTVDWSAEAGPNAVLAPRPGGYRRRDLSPAMLLELAAGPGFWPMGLRHGRHALGKMLRSLSPRRFLAALRRAWPSGRTSPGGW